MRLYLDDDSARPYLALVLRRAGHDVRLPADLGLAGRKDPIHLTESIRDNRVLISRNYQDFELLHYLVLQARGHHAGILIVRRDDSAKRNMSPQDIVRSLRNLEAAAVSVADQYIILNAWQ